MKKTLILSLLVVTLIGFGIKGQAYALLDISDLGAFGTAITLPTNSSTIDVLNGSQLRSIGVVDFAVLYNSSNSLYSYFYQVRNIGGGQNERISRFSFDNPYHYTLLGSGVMPDSQQSVYLDTSIVSSLAADFDPWFPTFGLYGDGLAQNETSKRFYFQFNEYPGMVSANLIDGGIGSGSVPGPVPEPSSMMLLGMGVLGLLGFRRKS